MSEFKLTGHLRGRQQCPSPKMKFMHADKKSKGKVATGTCVNDITLSRKLSYSCHAIYGLGAQSSRNSLLQTGNDDHTKFVATMSTLICSGMFTSTIPYKGLHWVHVHNLPFLGTLTVSKRLITSHVQYPFHCGYGTLP